MASVYDMKFISFFVFAVVLAGILTIPSSSAQDVIPSWIKNNAGWWATDQITERGFLYGIKYLVEAGIINFQSSVTSKETGNIGEHILDWDIIINDSLHAYDGSIRLTDAIFDTVNYTVRYNTVTNTIIDRADPTLLRAGVWLYQITGDEKFLQTARGVADVMEEKYLTDIGIVMNVHPITNTINFQEHHTNQEVVGWVSKLALIDSNYTQLTKTLANAVIEHETQICFTHLLRLKESQKTEPCTYHITVL